MDIKFEKDGFKFNVRSSCVIKNKDRTQVILNYMRAVKDHDAFLLPGGRLEILESSENAVLREIEEELGVKLDYKLISIQENIAKDIKFHMIEFVYYAEIQDFKQIKRLDDDFDRFKIVDIKDIDEFDVRPKTIKNLIRQKSYKDVTHGVNYDWI